MGKVDVVFALEIYPPNNVMLDVSIESYLIYLSAMASLCRCSLFDQTSAAVRPVVLIKLLSYGLLGSREEKRVRSDR